MRKTSFTRLVFACAALFAANALLAAPPYAAPTYKDVAFLAADRSQKMDIYLPPDNGTLRPAVVVIHGGGWSGGKKIWGFPVEFAKRMLPAGYAVFCADYQLNEFEEVDGKKTVKRKAGPQNVFDCMDAISFVRLHAKDYGVDPDRIAVAGASAGGHLALMVAYTAGVDALEPKVMYPGVSDAVRCVVDLFGPADLEFSHLGSQPAMRKLMALRGQTFANDLNAPAFHDASPVTYVSRNSPPTLVFHGRADDIVDYAQSENLVSLLRNAGVPCDSLFLNGVGHSFTLHDLPDRPLPMDLRPNLLRFLAKYL